MEKKSKNIGKKWIYWFSFAMAVILIYKVFEFTE